jgi:hypothetical protein
VARTVGRGPFGGPETVGGTCLARPPPLPPPAGALGCYLPNLDFETCLPDGAIAAPIAGADCGDDTAGMVHSRTAQVGWRGRHAVEALANE